MTPTLTAAAERLITLPGFKWMPGMVDVEGYRLLIAYDDGSFRICIYDEAFDSGCMSLPNLTDPATLGCVLAMVCDAWSDPGFTLYGERFYDAESASDYFKFLAEPSHVNRPESLRVWFTTRGECLVHALAAGAK
jgi:hypothetical protein